MKKNTPYLYIERQFIFFLPFLTPYSRPTVLILDSVARSSHGLYAESKVNQLT